MNLTVRFRYVPIAFSEKELKVLLVPSELQGYTLPEKSGMEACWTPKAVDDQFMGPISRIPATKQEDGHTCLTFDYYVLYESEMIRNMTAVTAFKSGQWFSVQKATQLDNVIAVTIGKTLKTLRQEINHQPIACNLLPAVFTMQEIISLYEIILDKSLNRGNFYRKMMRLEILEVIGVQRTGKAHKSPILYAFNETYLHKIDKGLFQEF